MMINADSLVPYLKNKVRLNKSDSSRHLLCPMCCIRTKLNILGDGRRKCTICGKKFRINKVTEGKKIQQCAQILLCFCLDLAARRTAQLTQCRYKTVHLYYKEFQILEEDEHAKNSERESNSVHRKVNSSLQNKSLKPDQRAKKIIDLMPVDFLTSWGSKEE